MIGAPLLAASGFAFGSLAAAARSASRRLWIAIGLVVFAVIAATVFAVLPGADSPDGVTGGAALRCDLSAPGVQKPSHLGTPRLAKSFLVAGSTEYSTVPRIERVRSTPYALRIARERSSDARILLALLSTCSRWTIQPPPPQVRSGPMMTPPHSYSRPCAVWTQPI